MADSEGIIGQIIDIVTDQLGLSSPAEILSGTLSFDEITDLIAEAGVDVSELSHSDIQSLLSFTDTDTTSIEWPDGTKLEHTETNQFGLEAGLLGAGGAAGGALGYKRAKGEQTGQQPGP